MTNEIKKIEDEKLEELLKDTTIDIDALNDSVLYEDYIGIDNDGFFYFCDKRNRTTPDYIGDILALKSFLKNKTDCNDSYHRAIERG